MENNTDIENRESGEGTLASVKDSPAGIEQDKLESPAGVDKIQ
jgi:hypothetical protein